MSALETKAATFVVSYQEGMNNPHFIRVVSSDFAARMEEQRDEARGLAWELLKVLDLIVCDTDDCMVYAEAKKAIVKAKEILK